MVKKYEPGYKYYQYETEPSLVMQESKYGQFVKLETFNHETARLNAQIARQDNYILKLKELLKNKEEKMHNLTIFDAVYQAAKQADIYHKNRTVQSIYNHALSEMGEIALEINIADGQSYKAAGTDGIVGETLDAIAAMIDVIYKVNPDFTQEDYLKTTNRLKKKMSKSMVGTNFMQPTTIHGLFNVAQAQMGKVALEINNMDNSKQVNNLVKEVVKTVVYMLDMIYKVNPEFTEAQLVEILNPKMKKWIEKIAEHTNELK